MKKIKLVSVTGPTASGKTALSIAIAKHYGGEVISADSMQIYKKMDIATAKPTKDEMQGIPHHLMDFVPPEENYSVADFVTDAGRVIRDIHSRGKLPILAGGTGLYVNSLLSNLQFSEGKVDPQLRVRLMNTPCEELLEQLRAVDPDSYEKLSKEKNLKRIARALEIYYQTGKPKSVVDREALSVPTPYAPIKLGLGVRDREYLYSRINLRVDLMLKNGLLDEAKQLLSMDLSATASKAIGYKEFIPYFNNEATLESCTELLKRETRRYAKRQLTWFRRDSEINVLNIDEYSQEELVKRAFEIIDKGLKNGQIKG